MNGLKEFKISRLFKALFIVSVLPAFLHAETSYNVITLEKIVNNLTYYPYSVNNNGEIVGYALGKSGASEAILFDPTGRQRSVELGSLPDYPYSRAYSINNYGQAVGYSFDSLRHSRATLFDISGRGYNIDLGTLSGQSSVAMQVNDYGQVVGYAQDKSGAEHATLFDITGRGYNIDLGTLPGCDNSYATSINNNGQIVGYCVDSSGQFYAAMFDPTGNGRNINLGMLNGLLSAPNKINNYGQVAGVAGIAPSTQHAALFKFPGGAGSSIDLGSLPARYGDSEALAINNNGQIVGYCINDKGESVATFFDSSGHGNNMELNTLIDPASGWTLNDAYSINDNGYIVGLGSQGAFLLEPVNAIAGGALPPDKY